MALINYQAGSFSGVTLCPISATLPPNPASGVATNAGAILQARYHLSAGAGTTAGAVTFQELGCDGVWRTMQDITALSLTAAGEYAGVINGPFHGLRLNVGAITGGTVTYAELIGATLT